MGRPRGSRAIATELRYVIRNARARLEACDGKPTARNVHLTIRLSNLILRAARELEAVRRKR